MLISKEVIVTVSTKARYYESLGYKIERYLDSRGKSKINMKAKLKVKVEDLPKSSTVKIEYKCESCDNIFETKYYHYAKKKNKKDLCRKCSFKIVTKDKKNIEKRSGVNHPRYNKDLTDEDREKGRHYPEYREWRKMVYGLCEYTCMTCMDDKGGNLVAHHLNGWHWCKDERFSAFNGITLCEDCHNEFHNTYGFENNTKDQFYDFMIEKIFKANNNEISRLFYDI